MEKHCVYCAVRTEYVWTQFNFSLLGRAKAQAVNYRPLTAESQVRTRAVPCEVCGGQSGTGTGFPPSTSRFLSQYHSTNAHYSSSS